MSNGRAPSVAILLPDLRGGGAERVCIYLANAFAARGIPVQMVLMRTEGELLPLLDERVEVVPLGACKVRHLPWRLLRYLRRAKPAALLANMWPLTAIAVGAARLARVESRVVVAEHTYWTASIQAYPTIHRIMFRLSMRALMRWADARVGVSDGVANDVERIAGLPRGAVRTVYNPIVGVAAAGTPEPAAPPVWPSEGGKRIIGVGSLKRVKRFDLLIDAFARLPLSDATLLILGEGSERAALEAQVRALGLDGRVCLPGFVPNPAQALRSADLFVLSSDYEGFGNVIVEALEQGIPVVSTDCPSGPREILEDGKYGALVPVGDVEALAKAMEDALSREHDREALKCRAQDFSVDKAADAYLDLLIPGWRDGSRV